MSISIFFRTLWSGRLIGMDAFGNKYYEDKKKCRYGMRRRWVIYKGAAEGSKVPSQWHGWLHYSTSDLPEYGEKYFWGTGTPVKSDRHLARLQA